MDRLNPIWLVVFTAVFAALPLLVGVATSYLKISIVLGILRSGLGTQHTPGALVTMVLSLALSLYIMAPVFEASYQAASAMKLEERLRSPSPDMLVSLGPVLKPWRDFMLHHAGRREIETLTLLATPRIAAATVDSGAGLAQTVHENVDPALLVLIPAFILSEVKEAIAMAFVLVLPFMVIDLIVANVLAGMGMYMLSPVIISLPLKLILFVAVDGWLLLAKGLIASYQS